MQMVMSKCQTVLENADTPNVLFAVVDVISFIVKNHPHCFRSHFRVCVSAYVLLATMRYSECRLQQLLLCDVECMLNRM